ncbi:hypothetical protein ACIQVT_00540 [Streptomyces sp. NPDC100445]|uniref:hypothetical protein n=1 Tax=Streptomyces sp. NPDC100445 TaxID=3366102 RepID=UPI003812A4BD
MLRPTLGSFEVATQTTVINVRPEDVLVIRLHNILVSTLPGLARLTVRETAFMSPDSIVMLSVLKREARVPSNFRAEKAFLEAATPTRGQDTLTLLWDGPNNLDYQIEGPDGRHTVTGTGPHWNWSPAASAEPKRDATYTLIATPQLGRQAGYFLTTTVQVEEPEFPRVTVTKAVHTPLVTGTGNQQGQIVFTADGVRVLGSLGAPGTVDAGEVDAESVLTSAVRGRGTDSGWVRFPDDGIVVGHGPGTDLGVVTADKIRVNGVNTPWVGDADGGRGWIDFTDSGIGVYKDGSRTWGDVAADKASLNGINTKWVQGPTSDDGWIDFPAAGLNIFRGGGDRQRGTVTADTADLSDLVTERAQVRERLTLQGGLTVEGLLETQDSPPRLVVQGAIDAEDELHVVGDARIGGKLAVRGDLGVLGKTNANGHLAVRAGDTWIIHTDDGQVSVQADLRVHGALRSDS